MVEVHEALEEFELGGRGDGVAAVAALAAEVVAEVNVGLFIGLKDGAIHGDAKFAEALDVVVDVVGVVKEVVRLREAEVPVEHDLLPIVEGVLLDR